jgi:hypothetical protein
MKRIDCSAWIDNPEEWTHGPVLPVGGAKPAAAKKRREGQGRKKGTKG